MWRNILKVAMRNWLKNKSYYLINVLGLGLGLGCALLVFTLLRFEYSTDTFHPQAERIYRVMTTSKERTGTFNYGPSPSALPAMIRANFPEVEVATANLETWKVVMATTDKATGTLNKFKEKTSFLDADFFKIFPFEFRSGTASVLNEADVAVLTERMARKLFGSPEAALGQTLRWNGQYDLRVAGILKDLPPNTDFELDVIVSEPTRQRIVGREAVESWDMLWTQHVFVRLPESLQPQQWAAQLSQMNTKRREAAGVQLSHWLQPLRDLHWDTNHGGINAVVPEVVFTILGMVGVLLVCTSCINFVNLATAQAVNRSREVGVRKVLGSSRGALVGQFMAEAGLITVVAAAFAWALGGWGLGGLNSLLELNIPQTWLWQWPSVAFMLGITVFTALASGFYPALVISGFQPMLAIKNSINTRHTGGYQLRRALVVAQFAISQMLVVITVMLVKQVSFLKDKDMGFDREAVISISGLPQSKADRLYALKSQLLGGNGIVNVSLGFATPSSESSMTSNVGYEDSKGKMQTYNAQIKNADTSYLATYGLTLLAGRNFAHADTMREIIVNERMMRQMGFEKPEQVLGQSISIGSSRDKMIVGVVKDFIPNTAREQITPCIISPEVSRYYSVGIKVAPQSIGAALAHTEQVWNSIFPEQYFEYDFLDEKIANFYKIDTSFTQLIQIFAVMAIIIGCIGLYGLVSFMAMRKTKEIGVRKVMGASVQSIVLLFSKEFARLLLMAALVAMPLAYWVCQEAILSNYAHKAELGVAVFALSLLLSFGATWLTVGYKSVRAALANPSKSLRTE